MKGGKPKTKTLPADLLAELKALKRHGVRTTKRDLTDEQKELLRHYKKYNIEQFAAMWKRRYGWGSRSSLDGYYREMIENEPE